jgi:hypothetical protein
VAEAYQRWRRDVRVIADRRALVGIGDKEGIAAAREERKRLAKHLEATYPPAVQVRQLPPAIQTEPEPEPQISGNST